VVTHTLDLQKLSLNSRLFIGNLHTACYGFFQKKQNTKKNLFPRLAHLFCIDFLKCARMVVQLNYTKKCPEKVTALVTVSGLLLTIGRQLYARYLILQYSKIYIRQSQGVVYGSILLHNFHVVNVIITASSKSRRTCMIFEKYIACGCIGIITIDGHLCKGAF